MVQWSTKDPASSSPLSLPSPAGWQLILGRLLWFSQLRVTHPPTTMFRQEEGGSRFSFSLNQGADPFQAPLGSLSSSYAIGCKPFHAVHQTNLGQREMMIPRQGCLANQGPPSWTHCCWNKRRGSLIGEGE